MDLPPSSGGEGGGDGRRSYSVGSGKSSYPPPIYPKTKKDPYFAM